MLSNAGDNLSLLITQTHLQFKKSVGPGDTFGGFHYGQAQLHLRKIIDRNNAFGFRFLY